MQQALRAAGVGKGDRVAGVMPNIPETILAMLAATSLGAVWASCSPDFGAQTLIDRLGQIRPKVIFTVPAYHYGGKTHHCLDKLRELAGRLPFTAESFDYLATVVVAPMAVVAPANAPYDTIAELIAYSQENGGALVGFDGGDTNRRTWHHS